MTRAELENAFRQCLEFVDEKAASSYVAGSQAMVARVNAAMEKRPDFALLIGKNSVDAVFANHSYHAEFVGSVLRTRSVATLIDTVTWFYRSSSSRGYHPDYWPVQMEAWKAAVRDQLGPLAPFVVDFYELLENHHSDFLEMSKSKVYETHPEPEDMECYGRYLEALLKPSSADALACAQEQIHTVGDITHWWEKIIEPAMHEIGRLWAVGAIYAGQEHIATAITCRVMSSFYPMILAQPRDKGRVVVTASPSELHELGPRMISDILEINGWNVYYLGANTPIDSVCKLLRNTGSRILAVSTTLPSNLSHTEKLIAAVRSHTGSQGTHILVGGQAYINDPDLWKSMGADAFAANGPEAATHLDSLSIAT